MDNNLLKFGMKLWLIAIMVVAILLVSCIIFLDITKAEEILSDTELLDKCFSEEGTVVVLSSGARIVKKNNFIIGVGRELTPEEKLREQKLEDLEAQRLHELKVETIKAQAMINYLIGQTVPFRDIANALRHKEE